ncbi:hypothetical protein CFC21_045675 [Triticum aestivum]|uniref:Uncharacterized protein n=2 Tax=Triticum aestivum TaxID=4565 RepID=A0A3B6GQE0_WHEAT|nr:uncharacterized protein LOC123077002 [Triticum aestivum]KAF7034694.1 hypothetical protein CFC21_045675 [Triticum aestivum]
MAALRLASALRRLPARTGQLGSKQVVLPPLAGRTALLARARSLPHLPAAVRRFSDKSKGDLLDRAATVIKEGKVISRDITKGIEGLEDLIGRQLDVCSIELSATIRRQIRHSLEEASQVPWGHLGIQALAFLSVGGVLAYGGGTHLFNKFSAEVKKITDDAMIEAEKRAKELAKTEWAKETAQLYIDQGMKSITLYSLFFGRKVEGEKAKKTFFSRFFGRKEKDKKEEEEEVKK